MYIEQVQLMKKVGEKTKVFIILFSIVVWLRQLQPVTAV